LDAATRNRNRLRVAQSCPRSFLNSRRSHHQDDGPGATPFFSHPLTTVVIRICHNIRVILSSTPTDTLTSPHPNSSRFEVASPADFTPAYPHKLVCRVPAHSPAAHSMEEIEEKVKMPTNRIFRFRTMFVKAVALSQRETATHSQRRSDLLVGFAPVGQKALETEIRQRMVQGLLQHCERDRRDVGAYC